MKALPICLTLMLLIGAGRPLHAQDEGLKLLPESPEHGESLLVYRDEGITPEDQCTWLAFLNGKMIAKKDNYVTNGGWLKLRGIETGTYTFVLTCKNGADGKRWAKTVKIELAMSEPAPAPLEKVSPEPLQLLPKRPALDKSLLVYRDSSGDADAKCLWLAFRDDQPLDTSEYNAKGGWLKVHGAQAGMYTFVLTGEGDTAEKVAMTVNLPAKAPAPRGPIKSSTISKAVESRAKNIIAALQNNPVSSTSNQPQNSADPRARRVLSDQETKLADALENVARLAMQQDWATPQIVKETRTASEQVAAGGIVKADVWESLEGLLKDVGLRFGESSIEENPEDTILALAALATALREDARLKNESLNGQLTPRVAEQSVGFLSTTGDNFTTHVATAPCCRRRLFFPGR